MKSKRILSAILIMLCFILSSCSNNRSEKIDNTVINPSKSERVITNEDSFILESESYGDGKIGIKYPQITQLSSEDFKKNINNKIRKRALNFVDDIKNDKKVTIFEMGYDVKRYDDKLLSILFQGYINSEGAPYPMILSYTMNINMDSGEELDLKKYFKIDEKYVELYHQKKLNTLESFQNEAFEGLSDEEILTMFNSAELYLTKDSLGLIVFVPHAVGDYAELEIKYNELESFIDFNTEWKSIVK